MPQSEKAGEEGEHVEGKIHHHEGATTPLGGGGRIRIHGDVDRKEAQSIKSGDEAEQGEGDRAGVEAGEDEGCAGDEVGDSEKAEKAKKIGGGGTREIETGDVGGGVGKNDRVHETAKQIDASEEDGHRGDKFRDGVFQGVSVGGGQRIRSDWRMTFSKVLVSSSREISTRKKRTGMSRGGKGGKRTESFSVVMRASPRRARVRVRAFSTSGAMKRWWSAKERW